MEELQYINNSVIFPDPSEDGEVLLEYSNKPLLGGLPDLDVLERKLKPKVRIERQKIKRKAGSMLKKIEEGKKDLSLRSFEKQREISKEEGIGTICPLDQKREYCPREVPKISNIDVPETKLIFLPNVKKNLEVNDKIVYGTFFYPWEGKQKIDINQQKEVTKRMMEHDETASIIRDVVDKYKLGDLRSLKKKQIDNIYRSLTEVRGATSKTEQLSSIFDYIGMRSIIDQNPRK